MSRILTKYIVDELKKIQSESELAEGQEKFAAAIAKAVEKYLDRDVKVTPGIRVTTTGSPAAQTGQTVTTGNLQAP